MILSRPLFARFACALALAGVGVSVMTSAVHAETYGELSSFTAKVGSGHGELKISPGTHAFAVDPTDDSVYVGDEITKKGEYRIQKLTASGAFVAQTATLKPPNHDGIEGIAVDTELKRIYLLALETRGATLTIAPNEGAAGTLYAFSSEPSGAVLEPAAGTNSEGVLAGPTVLEPQSDAPEVALLEPRGIAVDPTTHDVIVLGEAALLTEEEKEQQVYIALQRIRSSGVLGERYVDHGGTISPAAAPNSPVVSSAGAVYVAESQAQTILEPTIPPKEITDDELFQIPSDFASGAPPTPFVQLTLPSGPEEGRPVVEFEDDETPLHGDGLSFAGEEAGGKGQGTIYVKAHVFVGSGTEGAYYPGVLAFAGADGAEIGWTGGQTKKSGASACTLNFAGRTYSSVAAGKGRTVFVFDPGKESPPVSPRVVELGPGGKGCPTAEASEPVASINGQPLSPTEVIPSGTEVAFSSTLTQANALSVEWNFGDGQTTTVSTDEYRHTEVKHKFIRGGELTVIETIHTDDLATPTIVKQTKVSASTAATPPTAVLEGPTEVTLGGGSLERLVYNEDGSLELVATPARGEASFDASASSASTAQGPNRIETYHWTFGDGHSETTTTATAEHVYEAAGAYKVELTVTDAHGLTSEPVAIMVKVKNAPAPSGATTGAPAGTATAGTAPGTSSTTGKPATGTGHGSPPPPDVVLKSKTLEVGRTGAVTLELACPNGDSSCVGTVALRTLGALRARVAGSSRAKGKGKQNGKPAILTLASGTFTIAGGRTKTVTLRLTSRGRALLAHARTLRVRATIVAHAPGVASHTTQTTVTLRAA